MKRILILGLILGAAFFGYKKFGGTKDSDQPASASTGHTFTWATDGDPHTMDPYTIYEVNTTSFLENIYEPLVRRNDKLEIEACLATDWKQTDPTTLAMSLRKGVTFHDGSPFTADDVVFSLERARSISGAGISSMLSAIKEIKKIDDFKIAVITERPDPVLLSELSLLHIMSKTWCEANNTTKTVDSKSKEETFATRNANGTGPFKLVKRATDETVLERNTTWWNTAKHGIDKAILRPISSAATRSAAMLAGELDFMMPVPLQNLDSFKENPNVKVAEGPENRVIFFCMNQRDDELKSSNIKGKNPFKDQRVRLAIAKAIDIKAIEEKVMRGHAVPTALIFRGVTGYNSSIDKRWEFNPEEAKKLLAEAGYPEGFEVTLDCPNDRYVNDEQISVSVAAMLSKVGIKIKVNATPKAPFFEKVTGRKSDMYMMGWLPVTNDAHNALIAHVATTEGKSQGNFNFGGYSNSKADDLIKQIGEELDTKKRQKLIDDVSRLMIEDVSQIPLHQQFIFWAMKPNLEIPIRADNYFLLQSVRYTS